MTPKIGDLGYMAQASATLRRAEYTALLVKWLDDNLQSENNVFTDTQSPWHLKAEFSLAQTLLALA